MLLFEDAQIKYYSFQIYEVDNKLILAEYLELRIFEYFSIPNYHFLNMSIGFIFRNTKKNNSFVRSKLEYSVVVCNPMYPYQKFEILQKNNCKEKYVLINYTSYRIKT